MNKLDMKNLVWIKAKKSTGSGGNCVEVAMLPDGGRAIRDSKNPDGGMLMVSQEQWHSLLVELHTSAE